jgi:hypothetical protein
MVPVLVEPSTQPNPSATSMALFGLTQMRAPTAGAVRLPTAPPTGTWLRPA